MSTSAPAPPRTASALVWGVLLSVCGVAGIYVVGLFALPFAALGLVLSRAGLPASKPLGIFGIVVGAIGLLAGLLSVVALIWAFVAPVGS